MNAIAYSELQGKLDTVIDQVCDNHDPIIVTRQGRPSAVLISLEDYSSLDETAYLRSTKANERVLTESISSLSEGRRVEVDLSSLTP